ncbi:hydroxymethylglutaryl-CoA lyase [Shouchella hunanensis]|uniref:Hydroxymethylglutaryl-CoA lyase n=1 Tax=Shouchella hunanensis TaxID=766894 RepID=A0ABY7W0F0_9BACI|nr:hydroxymethylglutaryl-CoA lyase [Shouchella hunanensis]WDF02163.1 hydroxymethylglutaryl-CoA lyase [Shouchella hunanensis]GAF23132.1 hydroxymethylglutaryl-CoA lyase [Bacillus sp. JCM 19047]
MERGYPEEVTIWEVLPRDGFQMETWVETETKIKLIKSLAACGIRHIEATSFVHPRAIPQLKDAEAVVKGIQSLTDVSFRALVPNLKGAERAIGVGIKQIKLLLSATDSHSLANSNCTREEAIEKLLPVIELANQKNVYVGGALTVSFGCPYEGEVNEEELMKLIQQYKDMGIREISLADTAGMGNPKQVSLLLQKLKRAFPLLSFSLHLHNTRGMAFANVVAGLENGVTSFDSSTAGLGGCPYFPKAAGNIATEDLVHSLHLMGIKTGIDVDRLMTVAKEVTDVVGHEGSSFLLKAGQNKDLAKKPTGQEKLG